jgi:AAA15 family ATPase/GTPase
MIVKFTVGNYLSIKDRLTISFEATAISELQDTLIPTPLTDLVLLKGLAFYGANNSGKSNILKSIHFFRSFVLNSVSSLLQSKRIDVENFKLSNQPNKPSFFEMEFILKDVKYRYGFEINKERVLKEWLFSQKKIKEYSCFERKSDSFEIASDFDEGKGKDHLTRPNALFLTVMAQFNGSISLEILRWFRELTILSDANINHYINITAKRINDPINRKYVLKILEAADLGFNDVEVIKPPMDEKYLNSLPHNIAKRLIAQQDNFQVKTKHKKFDHNGTPIGEETFDLMKDESLGTQKYFALAGPIVRSILKGNPLIIDELDARLHPHLSQVIIKIFNSKNANPKNSQIVFSTHNTNILGEDLLRRDQVYIVDKDSSGSTHIETIADKKIRKDASFEKDYLAGKYGGVPKGLKEKDVNLFE